MKGLTIISFFLILPFLSSANTNSSYDGILEACMKVLNYTFTQISNRTLIVTEDCLNSIRTKYDINSPDSVFYFQKLIFDSSKNRNDVSSFSECLRKSHGSDIKNAELSYVMVLVDKRDNTTNVIINGSGVSLYFFGVCFVNQCSTDDMFQLVNATIDYLDNPVEAKDSNLQVLILEKKDTRLKIQFKTVLHLIPFIIILVQLVLVFWNRIPMAFAKFIYHCFIKREIRRNVSGNTLINNGFNEIGKKKHFTNYIKQAFNLNKNGEELFNYSKISKTINNDLGLTYIKGIKGVAMIFLLFGFFFIQLFNSPICLKSSDLFHQTISSWLFFIFFFGIRFSPKILLSCSGFTLFYKFLCFLDDKVDDEKQRKEDATPKNPTLSEQFDTSSSNFDSSIVSTDNSTVKQLTKKKFLFIFLFLQLHKYCIYVLVIFFIHFSLYYIPLFYKELGPMWLYFQKVILGKTTIREILYSLFLIHGYFIPSNPDSFLAPFWLLMNEMIFFIITSIYLFIGYKYHLRIDRFIWFTCLLIIVGKISFTLCNYYTLLPSYYFSYQEYGKFSTSPLYNYIYYLIGVYFSMLNYTLQKGINYDEAERQEKTYLFVSIKLINKFRGFTKARQYVIGSLCLFCILALSQAQGFIMLIINMFNSSNGSEVIKKSLTTYFYSLGLKLYLLIDCDILIILVQLFSFIFYIRGDNIVNKFLSNSFWSIPDKLYYCYILVLSPTIIYVLYQSETRINFDISNSLFYGMICGILAFGLSTFFYLVFEIPYKRLIHFMFDFNKKKEKQPSTAAQSFSKEEETKVIDLGLKD